MTKARLVAGRMTERSPRPASALIPVLAVMIGSVPASGQTAPSNAAARSFWVTEAGYAHSVSGPCSDHYPSFQAGKLVNLGGSMAAGATLFVGHNADVVFGPLPRARYWASPDVALDAAAGALWGASRVRPTGYVGVGYRDLLSVFVQYERYRDGGCGQPTEDQLFLGFRVGSRPGMVSAVVGSVIAGIIILSVIADIEN